MLLSMTVIVRWAGRRYASLLPNLAVPLADKKLGETTS